jgi:peptidoglycan/LPS O-acetylase OafA/YrhL
MTYYKTLDSIRAIAVFLVILSHWLPYDFVLALHFGDAGVDIFFVLSGFLITHNLLKEKKESTPSIGIHFKHLKNFIIRRSLRIFPVYYLLIFALAAVGAKTYTGIEQNLAYYLTYTSNILFFNTQQWDGMLSHLWSLAVEEQFYLIWPWLIIFTPERHVFKVITASFIFGIISTFVLKGIYPDKDMLDVLTPTCFDAFSLGAIWAYFKVYQTDKVEKLKYTFVKVAIICLIFFLFREIFQFDPLIPNRTFISIIALGLIIFAMEFKETTAHRTILENEFLIFVGKISYGVYLFHPIVPWLWNETFGWLGSSFQIIHNIPTEFFAVKFVFFLMKFGFLIVFCWLSFTYFENPINKLKHRFK